MRYQVPQFIEVEDKIFGQLTFKQFVYVAGSAGLGFVVYRAIPIATVSVPLAVAIVGFGLALAFYKPDGHRPFIFTVEQALKYTFGPKLYVWKKKERTPVSQVAEINNVKASDMFVPKLSQSKLRDLSWSLDIHENVGDASKKKDGFAI